LRLALRSDPAFGPIMTLYAIGDIHGQIDLLQAAHARVEADRARYRTGDAPLIHIGDLVDRGPDSAGVIDLLMGMTARDPRVHVLLGNHDLVFSRWLDTGPGPDPRDPPHIRYLADTMGGKQTLASYDIDPTGPPAEVHAEAQDKVPSSHRDFLNRLPRKLAFGDCLFVHAGIRPTVPIEAQDPDDLVWIRDDFLDSAHDHGPLIVHGHTVHDQVEHHGNRLAIDTGAAYGGPLSAVAIDGRTAYVLSDQGRVPV